MNNSIKKHLVKYASFTGAYNIIKRFKKGAVALNYHGIEYNIIDPRVQKLHMLFSQFERQIEYLRKNFEIITLDYLYECLTNGYKISPSYILLTFDDGYKNIVKIVAPFLRSLNIPFAVFINTHQITEKLRLPTYYLRAALFYSNKKFIDIPNIKKKIDISSLEKLKLAENYLEKLLKRSTQKKVKSIINDIINLIPLNRWFELNDVFHSDELMNWDDIKKLHNLGVTIGSHCHDHFILHSNQNQKDINYQLTISKKLIEKNLGDCKYIAYPNGEKDNITFDSLNIVKRNYLLGFTACPGEIKNKSNPFALPRIGITKDLEYFKFKIWTSFRYNRKIKAYFNFE
ncbi:MAG: polysaccharide deacetylase family protein [Candidatus Helarchaeota archaeon]